VGCGVISGTHARAVRDGSDESQLVGVTDTDRGKAEKVAAEYGVEVIDSLEAMLARDDIDVISVCVPSGLHAEVALQAIAAGKHVVVEKPADVSIAAIDKMITARDAAGVQVACISQHRFDGASQLVHEAVTEGRFGEITSGSAAINWWRSQPYYDSGEWRGTWELDGGGALMNQGVHSVDLLVWLLGTPVEVFAYTALRAHERIEVEDVAVASVKFESGAVGTVLGTTAAYPGLTTRLHVHGAKGSAVIDNNRLTYYHVKDETTKESNYGASGAGNQAEQVIDADARRNDHAEQYRDFLTALATNGSPLVTLEQARRSVGLVLGIYESARTGAPVSLTASA
jgi:predicted dehydrogenase